LLLLSSDPHDLIASSAAEGAATSALRETAAELRNYFFAKNSLRREFCAPANVYQ
jgi:hypothetical protein